MENSILTTKWLSEKTQNIFEKVTNEGLTNEDIILLILQELRRDIEKLEKRIETK